jgi:hypothetical protein
MSRIRRPLFLVRCGAITSILVLGLVSSASAATKLELTVGSEPVESITTQLGGIVSGGGSGEELWMHIKPTGGEGCAANPAADHGERLSSDSIDSTSPFTATHNQTFGTAGTYLLCGWVTPSSLNLEEVHAKAETTIAVRQPHLSLSISVPPAVLPGQTFQLSTTAQTETTRAVWEYLMPNTGRGCPVNADAATHAAGASRTIGGWDVTGGPFTEVKNQSLTDIGSYVICAYFEYPSVDLEAPPELTASAQVVVVSPPPPCVVPVVRSRSTVARAKSLLAAANCTAAIRYARSRHVRRGRVIGLTSRPHTTLPSRTRVTIVVSLGHRR